MEQNFKAIKITADAYNKLSTAKEMAVKQAKKHKNNDLAEALVAMGIGAFAGWLIFKAMKELD